MLVWQTMHISLTSLEYGGCKSIEANWACKQEAHSTHTQKFENTEKLKHQRMSNDWRCTNFLCLGSIFSFASRLQCLKVRKLIWNKRLTCHCRHLKLLSGMRHVWRGRGEGSAIRNQMQRGREDGAWNLKYMEGGKGRYTTQMMNELTRNHREGHGGMRREGRRRWSSSPVLSLTHTHKHSIFRYSHSQSSFTYLVI